MSETHDMSDKEIITDIRASLAASEAELARMKEELAAMKKLYDEDTATIMARCKHERDTCLNYIHEWAITEDMLRAESKMRIAWKQEATKVPELEAENQSLREELGRSDKAVGKAESRCRALSKQAEKMRDDIRESVDHFAGQFVVCSAEDWKHGKILADYLREKKRRYSFFAWDKPGSCGTP